MPPEMPNARAADAYLHALSPVTVGGPHAPMEAVHEGHAVARAI